MNANTMSEIPDSRENRAKYLEDKPASKIDTADTLAAIRKARRDCSNERNSGADKSCEKERRKHSGREFSTSVNHFIGSKSQKHDRTRVVVQSSTFLFNPDRIIVYALFA